MNQEERRICFSLNKVANMVGDLMRIATIFGPTPSKT